VISVIPSGNIREGSIRGPHASDGGSARARRASRGRVRVSAAEGVRESVLAGLGLAIASEGMFALELSSAAVEPVLLDWSLPQIDLWAVFPTGRQASANTKAH
jgi:DNA-binding transcriptional LysR family regulator